MNFFKDTAWGSFYIGNNAISRYLNDQNQFWDGFLLPVFDKYINSESIVLELGASCGFHSIYLSKKAKTIYSFEPQEYLYNLLLKNIERNAAVNITPFNLACYSEDCQMSFLNDEKPNYDNFGHYDSLCLKKDANGQMRAVKLDNFEPVCNLEKIDFIKCDCEGMDPNVILGAQYLIEKHRPVIVFELYDKNDKILEFLKEKGYNLSNLSPNDYLAEPN